MPGIAMLPGSTSFSVIRPSNGRDAGRVAAGGGACQGFAGLPNARVGAGEPGFRRLQTGAGIVSFLRRRGLLLEERHDAVVRGRGERQRRARRITLGRRGARALIGRRACRACLACGGGEVAAVEDDEGLARADAIARHDAHIENARHDARDERGGGAGPHDPTRVERRRQVGQRGAGGPHVDRLA
jgi:hypothetical protein